jgi:ABC-type lipoprotein export system ATPase subunit
VKVLELRDVSKTYDLGKGETIAAVRDVGLHVGQSEFLVVTGRSGSGKTTLLNLAAGITRPTSGSVLFDGDDLWGIPDAARSHLRNRRMGFVFQFPSLLPGLTVLRNVTLPLVFDAHAAPERAHRAAELLDMVGLGDRLRSYPRQLSAGQQQRVVIARALINEPELLLADEPSSDLDERTEREIMELFGRIHRETGVTIVMVTHSSELVTYGTRHVEVAEGSIRLDACGGSDLAPVTAG